MVIMEEISEVFDSAEIINVYNEGTKTAYSAGGKEYESVLTVWNKTIVGAYEMPAYGVSLNNLTVEEMQKNLWLEFEFGKELQHNGMPFEKLLVQVQKEFYGFNLIRYMSGHGYDGRCFYLDLNGKNMDGLYDLLIKL